MARTAPIIQIDIDRIQIMIDTAIKNGNEDTINILSQAQARIEGELNNITRDSRATRVASIDNADAELIAFEKEANVSRELRAAIANSRSDLVNLRKNA